MSIKNKLTSHDTFDILHHMEHSVSSAEALHRLKEGNKRFLKGGHSLTALDLEKMRGELFNAMGRVRLKFGRYEFGGRTERRPKTLPRSVQSCW